MRAGTRRYAARRRSMPANSQRGYIRTGSSSPATILTPLSPRLFLTGFLWSMSRRVRLERAGASTDWEGCISSPMVARCIPKATARQFCSGAIPWGQRVGGKATETQTIACINHGTLQNGTTFVSGQFGQGFGFDGVDDYVRLLNSVTNPFPAAGFTYAFW